MENEADLLITGGDLNIFKIHNIHKIHTIHKPTSVFRGKRCSTASLASTSALKPICCVIWPSEFCLYIKIFISAFGF